MPALKKAYGFTLIELVIGMVTLSFALMIMTGALFPQAQKSTDPWFQVRSAELAQSLMNEILARRFDENSALPDSLRCNESTVNCLAETSLLSCSDPNLWTEESNRSQYDDVDDFHCYAASGTAITNIANQSLQQAYAGFSVLVTVQYAGTELGLASNTLAKRIVVTVTPPRGDNIVYTSYKANY